MKPEHVAQIAELEQLCSYCAYNVYERFSDYRERGSEYAYHYGVAELTAYYNCYSMLMSETEGSLTNRKYLNSLLGGSDGLPGIDQGTNRAACDHRLSAFPEYL